MFLGSYPVLVVGTTSRLGDVPTDLQTAFLHEVKIKAPSEEQRKAILSMLTENLPLGKEMSLTKLARQSAVSALSLSDREREQLSQGWAKM